MPDAEAEVEKGILLTRRLRAWRDLAGVPAARDAGSEHRW